MMIRYNLNVRLCAQNRALVPTDFTYFNNGLELVNRTSAEPDDLRRFDRRWIAGGTSVPDARLSTAALFSA